MIDLYTCCMTKNMNLHRPTISLNSLSSLRIKTENISYKVRIYNVQVSVGIGQNEKSTRAGFHLKHIVGTSELRRRSACRAYNL